MKTFNVTFHKEDNVDTMQVQKLSKEELEQATGRETRRLFDLDTNVGYFVFFDAEDEEGDLSYLVLQYEEESEDPSACYAFEIKDFYEFMTLYLQGIDEYEEDEDDDDDEQYGPIHHLAHLFYHIAEEGKVIKP